MPPKLRKILFWMHLVTGVVAGSVVLMMSVTGVLLTYEMQLNRWAMRDYRASRDADARPLALDALLEHVRSSDPGLSLTSITLSADPLDPAELRIERERLYVDRYTGVALGDGSGTVRNFLREVMYWHRWFAMSGEERPIGRAVTGAANLGFLFLVVSGFFLWWPRSWTPAALRNVVWFRGGLSGKARNYNWHNVLGLWMCVPLFIIVVSGAVISYRWAGNLVYTLTGSELPTRNDPADEPTGTPPVVADMPASLDEVVRYAAFEVPGWQSLRLTLPKTDWEPVTVALDVSPGRQPHKVTTVTVDRLKCRVLSRTTSADNSRGRRLRSWLRFAHTGEVYGVVGQTVAGIATTGAAVLVWTGLALAWRRFRG